MTIKHHPTDELLMAYAAGTLDQGQHLAIATHLLPCQQCRDWVQNLENMGGVLLDDLPPTAMANDAFENVLNSAAPIVTSQPPQSSSANAGLPGLPAFAQRAASGRWTWAAPHLQLQRLNLPDAGDTRVFLLKSKPGTRFLPHRHTGLEMTSVLAGSFRHDGQHYGPGDFDFGDTDTSHAIEIGREGPCISLVAMQGKLQLTGFIGRLVQPMLAI
jgi:putative transcriptional regulator